MRTDFELKKLSEWWFDIAKIALASMVIKLFEPGESKFTNWSVVSLVAGLTMTVLCARIGIEFARKVRDI